MCRYALIVLVVVVVATNLSEANIFDVPTCEPNRIYKTCGPACPPTCEDPDPDCNETPQCKAGCFCIPGLIENMKGGNCISPSLCP
uniref:Cysteine-rich venom protein 1 n=1 Tax=Pimpla hypochondriaca TaxID=135724 RepID=TIL1_PIMHY|nr:RecName: Full=Cysteine-rich venom protein 1; Short=cvp1; Flags: Precursor [Pimpla hypochondriaca]CAD27737.1 cysteine-rich venom protein 1 [Pimpla hypochondriaca]